MTRYYHSSKLPRRSISVSQFIFKIFSLTLFALASVFVSSCEENPTKIGMELLPGNDFVSIKSTDTISARSYTMYEASVRSDNPSVSFLGQMNDPYFGTTTAEFVTQIRMAAAWEDKAYTIDSVRLILNLLEAKGSTDVVHFLKISEIAEQLYTDSVYYSNKPVLTTGYNIPDIVIPVLRPDTINTVSLEIPTGFGYYITRDPSQLFYNNNKPDFRAFFKGLYFQFLSSPDPLMVSLSLVTSSTEGYRNFFVIYLRDDAGVSSQFYFVLDATNANASFNRFSHDFTTATLGNKMVNRNTTIKDTLSYLQSLNGVYTKIVLPGLTTLKNDPSFKNISINRARLTVPVQLDNDLYKTSTIPPVLILRYRSKSGNKYYVPDYSIDDQSQSHYFFNGRIDTLANVYNFNIPAFVQGYLNDATGEIQPELEVFQGPGLQNAIFKANSSKTPVKFLFTYTKF